MWAYTGLIEIVRDFHEGSGAPVVPTGEELLPQKLKQWKRIHGRMLYRSRPSRPTART